MKRILKAITLVVACLTVVSAQQAETRTGTTAGSQANTSAKHVNIQSGTHIKGELQNTLDVRKAKVGDRVVLKTTEAIKSDGRKVANKGAKLVGHVTEVTRKTKANGASQISILFDTMQDGSLAFPITATIESIIRNSSNARLGDDNQLLMESNARAASNASMAPAGGGGLVGGVTNTVGGTVNSSTTTVGSLVGATTGAANSVVSVTGNTTGASTSAVSGSLRRIQISESSNTSTSGSSVLSLNGENLRLEKGTTFDLVVGQSGQVGASKQP